MEKKMICCICGKTIENEYDANNPYPVRPYTSIGDKVGRCCGECNQKYVLTFRMLNLGEGEAYENSVRNLQLMSKEQIDAWMKQNGVVPIGELRKKKNETL